LKALLAFYKNNPIDYIASCFGISVKSLKRWIKRYENNGIDFVSDENRTGRPSRLSPEQQELIKKEIQKWSTKLRLDKI
jgi:transposase